MLYLTKQELYILTEAEVQEFFSNVEIDFFYINDKQIDYESVDEDPDWEQVDQLMISYDSSRMWIRRNSWDRTHIDIFAEVKSDVDWMADISRNLTPEDLSYTFDFCKNIEIVD